MAGDERGRDVPKSSHEDVQLTWDLSLRDISCRSYPYRTAVVAKMSQKVEYVIRIGKL